MRCPPLVILAYAFMEEQVSSDPALSLVTGKNTGNQSSRKGLLVSHRREFSPYFAPFPVIPNRELSGKYLPVASYCFPPAGDCLQAAKAEGGYLSMQPT
jgi:hypothetical protein